MSAPPPTDPDANTTAELSAAATLVRRRRFLWVLAGGAVGAAAAGLVSASLVRSPAQRLADTAPPPRSVLTAIVEQRILAETVVLRGTVGADTTVAVTPTPREAERAIVTRTPTTAGDQVDAGSVLVEVSGRPLSALTGEVPAFRDLRPGMRGLDVTQLQAALAGLGHDAGDPDGELGPRTKAALAAFYDQIGYEVPTTGDAAALVAADDAVRNAERAVIAAEETLEQLREEPPEPGPGEPDPVAEAERQVRFAREDLDAARAARDEVERTTGAVLPLSEVVFLPDFPARVEQSVAVVGLDVTQLEGPLLTVSSGELVARTLLNPAQRELVSEGMPVEILSELTGTNASGEIEHIGELESDPATGERGHAMTVAATDGPLHEQLAGADVRLTVETAATDEQVLVVPLSAVFTSADGRVAVLRLDPDGTEQRVEVTAGVSGDGYVAVAPITGDLAAGDQVVIGSGGGV